MFKTKVRIFRKQKITKFYLYFFNVSFFNYETIVVMFMFMFMLMFIFCGFINYEINVYIHLE